MVSPLPPECGEIDQYLRVPNPRVGESIDATITSYFKTSYSGCHSERSEESRLFKYLKPCATLRVTRKTSFEMACSNFLAAGLSDALPPGEENG
ncbi:MAG: hypothetical protein ACOZFS_00030 [Thermodesulfobacteriota bacterium]